MSIECITWNTAEETLRNFLPGAKRLLPSAIADAAKAAQWQIKLYKFKDESQSRSDESYLIEFMSRAGNYIRGHCIIILDESFDKGRTPFAMEYSDIAEFVRAFPSMVFDGDLIVISPSTLSVVAYQFEGPDSVMFIAHP